MTRILRLARRPTLPIPHPLLGPALAGLGRRLGAGALDGALYGDAVRFLRYGRGVDNRRLRSEVGFEPAFDALGAVRDFVERTSARRIGPTLHPGSLAGRLAGMGS